MDYISTTFNNTMPHAQRLGAQLRPQQVHPVILLPQKFPASKTCKWNAPNIQNNERLQDFCLTSLFKITQDYIPPGKWMKLGWGKMMKNQQNTSKYMPSHRFRNKWALGSSLPLPVHCSRAQAQIPAPERGWMGMHAWKAILVSLKQFQHISNYLRNNAMQRHLSMQFESV